MYNFNNLHYTINKWNIIYEINEKISIENTYLFTVYNGTSHYQTEHKKRSALHDEQTTMAKWQYPNGYYRFTRRLIWTKMAALPFWSGGLFKIINADIDRMLLCSVCYSVAAWVVNVSLRVGVSSRFIMGFTAWIIWTVLYGSYDWQGQYDQLTFNIVFVARSLFKWFRSPIS